MAPQRTRSWAASARGLYLVAMAVFVVTVSIGIANGLDAVEFDRNAILTHVHSGTLGWIDPDARRDRRMALPLDGSPPGDHAGRARAALRRRVLHHLLRAPRGARDAAAADHLLARGLGVGRLPRRRAVAAAAGGRPGPDDVRARVAAGRAHPGRLRDVREPRAGRQRGRPREHPGVRLRGRRRDGHHRVGRARSTRHQPRRRRPGRGARRGRGRAHAGAPHRHDDDRGARLPARRDHRRRGVRGAHLADRAAHRLVARGTGARSGDRVDLDRRRADPVHGRDRPVHRGRGRHRQGQRGHPHRDRPLGVHRDDHEPDAGLHLGARRARCRPLGVRRPGRVLGDERRAGRSS